MKNSENKLLNDLSNLVDNKMDYDKIVDRINFAKYKKNKNNPLNFSKHILFPLATSIMIVLVVLVIVLLPKGESPNKPNVVHPLYSGFIKDSFEKNISDEPKFDEDSFGPMPSQPIIDGLFFVDSDITFTPSGNPNDDTLVKPEIMANLNLESFNYIYEVEYSYIGTGLEYVTVYLEKNLANKIYNECNNVDDALSAAPLNTINGSIAKWFYSSEYYDEDKVFWCAYATSDKIYAEINGYVCIGVFQPQKREIVREIVTNTNINIIDNIYTTLYFKNNSNEYLTAINDKVENRVEWYGTNNLIDETNTYFLFSSTYNSCIDCVINKEANEIKLKTYAIQDEEELNKLSSCLIKDYYVLSNSIIIENKFANEKFGQKTYLTYKYKEFIEIIQELFKNK